MKRGIKPGSVVVTSGGPKMTIEKVADYNTAHCVWFDQRQYYKGSFGLEALREVSR